MQDSIITERLLMTPLTLNDQDFIFELVNSDGWLKFIGNRNIHSREDAKAYIEKILNNPGITYWVARLKDNNIPIGIISFIKREYLEHYDIGFALLPKFECHGYAFEGAAEVLQKVIDNPKHANILATTIPQNISSIRLLKKLGFTFYEEITVENQNVHVYAFSTARA